MATNDRADFRQVQLTRKQGAKIRADSAGAFDHPLYAVNWLNLKRPARYRWYTRLAFSHLVKVGAKVFFKGYVAERLRGDEKYDREMLLLVCYPGPESFLKLISNRWFQVKSVLRVSAISRFVFGFVQKQKGIGKVLARPEAYSGGQHYMVHIFQAEQPDYTHLLFQKDQAAVRLYFLGARSASIARVVKGKEMYAPFFVNGISIWQAATEEALRAFAESTDFKAFCGQNRENNVYLVKRTI